MGDLMHPIPFDRLMTWARQEYRGQGAILGIRREKFYRGKGERDWYGERLGTVVGPAAGPHSQLAQNIIAAYLAGGRFIELKTVQKMDGEELRACVAKPCINAGDECYNVEWSTELTVEEAFDEYLKAWFALHVLQRELDLGEGRDFAFNMSVGYDLDGIRLPKIDNYIEGMKDASGTAIWKSCTAFLEEHLADFARFGRANLERISPAVCRSITLSTLHGCPPDEIERIARYLLEEKGLTTYVKCNPTLLGYETARGLLDEMGYTYIAFDDHHFKGDLQFSDAVAMFRRLQQLAGELKLGFGVKLTNTFPVQQRRGELPGEEMYMSGRSLLPLTLHVADRLSRAFNGGLPISYSGGADAGNIDRIFRAGIYPITVATTLLKPGGYERLRQLAELLEPMMDGAGEGVDPDGLSKLAGEIVDHPRYVKSARAYPDRKTDSDLGPYDCFKAPCKDGGCPIHQQVPEYVELVGQGRYDEAMEVIAIDNAAPAITSVICNHQCQSKCTRMDYESPVQIRGAKNVAVTRAMDKLIERTAPSPLRTEKKAVVIGAGPAGIAAGFFLRRNGMAVTVLEKRAEPWGIVRHVIPEFRIAGEMLERDYRLALRSGVEFRFGVDGRYTVEELRREYDFVIIATGAWGRGSAGVRQGGGRLVDALEMLADARQNGGKSGLLGRRVAVIGGGDVAMDCARVAARNPGTEQAVIVYRRTREFMPAEREELRLALEDGVQVMELLSPESYDGEILVCDKMALGGYDSDRRRSVSATGETVELPFDTVIAAVGARVETEDMTRNGIRLDDRGRVAADEWGRTGVPGVYVAGDCRRGPSTVVRAVADAKAVAMDILRRAGLDHDFRRVGLERDEAGLYAKKGDYFRELPHAGEDAARCLACDRLCELCNDVCPNRANVHIAVDSPLFGQTHQILHLDGMCNECGNCTVFCPHRGRPYRDKITVFWSEAEFLDSENPGFVALDERRCRVRTETGEIVDYTPGGGGISPQLEEIIRTVREDYPYYLTV